MRQSQRVSTISSTANSQRNLIARENKRTQNIALKSLREAEDIALSLVSQEVDTSEKDTSGEDEVFSEEDYWIDTSALELLESELPSPLTPFPQPQTDSERWSTSVNCFEVDTAATETAAVDPTAGAFPLL